MFLTNLIYFFWTIGFIFAVPCFYLNVIRDNHRRQGLLGLCIIGLCFSWIINLLIGCFVQDLREGSSIFRIPITLAFGMYLVAPLFIRGVKKIFGKQSEFLPLLKDQLDPAYFD